MKGKERRNIHSLSSSVHISYALPSLIFNKRERQASDRRQLDVYLFAFLSSRFAHIFEFQTNRHKIRDTWQYKFVRVKAQGKGPAPRPSGLTWVTNTADVGFANRFSAVFPFVWPTKRSWMCFVWFWEMGWRVSLQNAFSLALIVRGKMSSC